MVANVVINSDHSQCQRWNHGRAFYRPAGEPINTERFMVEPIPERDAKAFVCTHHYSGTYPAARFRAGLFEDRAPGNRPLVGTAVFSVPMNNKACLCHTGQPNGVELGRFVLLDEIGANAETWFLARAIRLMSEALPEIRAVLSYSDPVPRMAITGDMIMPGHLGTIYQASNARYIGRSRRRTLHLTRAGLVLNERTLSKLRTDDQGAAYAYEQIRAAGAPPRRPLEDNHSYVARALAEGPFRAIRHPGNHIYVFAVGDRRQRRDLLETTPRALDYPKILDLAA